jgi:hypothetical protein
MMMASNQVRCVLAGYDFNRYSELLLEWQHLLHEEDGDSEENKARRGQVAEELNAISFERSAEFILEYPPIGSGKETRSWDGK